MQIESPVTKEEAMPEYTFRVDTPHGYEITTLAAESITAAKAEVMKRSRRDSIDVSLIGIRSLTPQIPLVKISSQPTHNPVTERSNMDFNDFIEAAKKYNDLGWAVQEQLDNILNRDYEDLNPEAVRVIAKFAQEIVSDIQCADELLDALEDYKHEQAAS